MVAVASVLEPVAEDVVVAAELVGLAGPAAALVGAVVAVPDVVAGLVGREAVELVEGVAGLLVLDAQAFDLVGEVEALVGLAAAGWERGVAPGRCRVKAEEEAVGLGVEDAGGEVLLEVVEGRGEVGD